MEDTHNNGIKCSGVVLKDGTEIKAKAVLSGATLHVTFQNLLSLKSDIKIRKFLGEEFVRGIENIDYTSPVTKINGLKLDNSFDTK